jgi:hypothetical protein
LHPTADARPRWLRSLAAYVVVFGLLGARWIGWAAHAIPWGDPAAGETSDARLHVALLGWVARALVTPGARLFDAPFNHPAPAQLTGSEHFLSSQVVFAPVFWATGNPVLAANVLVLLSYPLAALAMERLLLRLGASAPTAWVVGLGFALGPFRVPANMQLPQYLNLYLPIVALALVRLREAPAAGRAAALALALVAAVFSSYYMAAFVAVTAGAWTLVELARPAPRRPSFALLAAAAGLVAFALLAWFSLPYLGRPEARVASASVALGLRALARLLQVTLRVTFPWLGVVTLALAAAGIAALAVAAPPVRRLAAAGAALVLAGWLLLPGAAGPLGPAFDAAFGFVRYTWRFAVVIGFGAALLAAAALEAVRALGGPRAGVAAAALAGAAWLGTRGVGLAFQRADPVAAVAAAPVYRAAGAAARAAGSGPLLELPGHDPAGRPLEADGLVGSAWHRLPLIGGHTGYPPPHRWLVLRAIARLPSGGGLADLVDMTHLRWLLLRPPEAFATAPVARPLDRYGIGMTRAERAALLARPDVTPVLERDGWVLARVDRVPRHPEWFAAIAAGPVPGRSPLGTPLEALPPDATAGAVRAVDPPRRARPGAPLDLRVRVRNRGTAGWPVAPAPPGTWSVGLRTRWHAPGAVAVPPPVVTDLVRDVPPGEHLTQRLVVPAPATPGRYRLEVALVQAGAPAARIPPLRLAVRVVP